MDCGTRSIHALKERSKMVLLEVQDLRVHFGTPRGVVRAVDGISFHVNDGETVAIVGESGCGKSVTSLSILRLVPAPPARITGEIRFAGQDLLCLSDQEIRAIRGDQLSMVFQEPMTNLNPVLTVGYQIGEALRFHRKLSAKDLRRRVVEMMELVGIPAADSRVDEYPHQLSGGMCQRVMIAIALSCNPRLLIADEPTTALDVTVQAQVLELMRDMKARIGTAIVLIAHDLGVVAEMAERVIVMYAGRKVEEGSVRDIFRNPLHPYTRGLLGAMPRLGSTLIERQPLSEIPGAVPSLGSAIVGCAFVARCSIATELCHRVAPVPVVKGQSHSVACHYSDIPRMS